MHDDYSLSNNLNVDVTQFIFSATKVLKMGSLKYVGLGILFFALVSHPDFIKGSKDEEEDKEGMVDDKSIKDDGEARWGSTVVDTLREIIERDLPKEEEYLRKREAAPIMRAIGFWTRWIERRRRRG